MNTQINGNDLIEIGYEQGEILGLALRANRKRTGYSRDEMIIHYKNVLENAAGYLDHKIFGKLATAMIEKANSPVEEIIALVENSNSYAIYGKENIEEGAIKQMDIAMKLPVTVAGALMPDAHPMSLS